MLFLSDRPVLKRLMSVESVYFDLGLMEVVHLILRYYDWKDDYGLMNCNVLIYKACFVRFINILSS